MTTPILILPELSPSQAQPHLTVNDALRRIDAVCQLIVKGQQNTPAVSPDEGDRYLVGAGTGDWLGHDDEVAVLIGGAWQFFTPTAGWRAFDQDSATMLVYGLNSPPQWDPDPSFSASTAAADVTYDNATSGLAASDVQAALDEVMTIVGPTLSGYWRFDDVTTAAYPGNGQLRYNNATPASVTALYLSQTSNPGTDATRFLGMLEAGMKLLVQQQNDSARYLILTISGAATDHGTWWTIPGTVASSGTLPADGTMLNVVLFGAGINVTAAEDVTYDNGASGLAATDVQGAIDEVAATVASSAHAATAGRHAIYIAAAAITPSASGGCAALATIASAANQPDIQTLDFDATTQEYAQFSLRMPKSWNQGTITFVPAWSHAATTTNFGVVWDLQAVAVSDDDAIAVAFGTAQTSTDTGGTTNDLYLAPESAAITVSGSPVNEDMVFFRLSRVTGNGSDTMAIDARLHGLTLYVTTNAENDA